VPDTVTITDNRTGKSYELPIIYGTYPEYGASIPTGGLRQIKVSEDDFGLMGYDPGFGNTGSCKSSIAFIDGERGILRYRGYPIEELADRFTFLDVAYLILNGELPDEQQSIDWEYDITHHTMIHEKIKLFMRGFQYDAHPMGMLVSTVAALSTFYHRARNIEDPEVRKLQMTRLIAKMPTIAAFAHRSSIGMPYSYPDNDLSFPGNFLNMMFKTTELKYEPNPVIEKALDVLFILHADHEQNCSTNVMRGIGSSHADPYVGLMGFGHRVYKNYDPRAKILREMAPQVFAVTGSDPLLDIAIELERIALEDDYFVSRNLYPNVDFYSGIIYKALGFPVAMFPVLFAIPRTVGWLTQWEEMLEDGDQRIARPRQIYEGEDIRSPGPPAGTTKPEEVTAGVH
jgi:citrate synthase